MPIRERTLDDPLSKMKWSPGWSTGSSIKAMSVHLSGIAAELQYSPLSKSKRLGSLSRLPGSFSRLHQLRPPLVDRMVVVGVPCSQSRTLS